MKFAMLLLALALPVCASQKSFDKLKCEQTFNDYTVRISDRKEETGMSRFEILRGGKRVYSGSGEFFEVGKINFESSEQSALIKMGQAITSDRQPNLLVSEWNSGNNSDCVFHIFQIGDTFKQIAKIDASQIGETSFQDLRHDANLEIVTGDTTFCYWNCDGSESKKLKVVLRYQNGKYSPDLELMRKPAPEQAEIKTLAQAFKLKFHKPENGDRWGVPVQMWQKMLDLIYTGNMNAAWILCDLSWPKEYPGKQRFLKEFKKQLQQSPYYAAITQAGFQR
jgi:hypothetical protein